MRRHLKHNKGAGSEGVGGVSRGSTPHSPPSLAATVGKGHSPSCFIPRHLSDCSKGACQGAWPPAGWRAGGSPPGLAPLPSPGPCSGTGPQACRVLLFSASLHPAEPSLPGGLLQLQHVLMEAGVSMATLTSRAWSPNAASRPQHPVLQQLGPQGRRSGCPALARPGHQRHTGVNWAGQASPAAACPTPASSGPSILSLLPAGC